MSSQPIKLGILAGSRSLPLLIAKEARRQGVSRIVAIGFKGETDPALASMVDEMVWLRVGQLSKIISVFQKAGISECVMAGQIAPKNLFDVRPDLRAMMLLLRIKEKNAHTIFGGIANEMEKDGIKLIEATPWLKAHMPGRDFHLGPQLSNEQKKDIDFGVRIAREIARLDIGQTVVIKNGVVLAVEGFEGTDKCIQRGGELSGAHGGAVVVKVAKTNHDMRFDIPCIGPQTVQSCLSARMGVLAIEAGKTILLEGEKVMEMIKKTRLIIVSIQ